MWVGLVELSDFRNHQHTRITLTPGVTIFLGLNGQGKTNFVESLVVLSQLSSHRVTSDAAMVRSGAELATVRASVHHDGRVAELALELKSKGANRAKINGDSRSVSTLRGWLKVVIFAPEDLSIVRGDPSIRRRFLDELTVSVWPQLHQVTQRYDKVVRQRNALLKTARNRSQLSSELAAWDDEFSALCAEITQARLRLIVMLQPEFTSAYHVISPGDQVNLHLETQVDTTGLLEGVDLQAHYREILLRRSDEERERAMTLVGPHRDDLAISLRGMPSRSHASHGEAWSLALGLKIGSAELLRKDSASGDPVIILDDVLAELDRRRRDSVVELVASYEQVLITAAVEEDIPEALDGTVFRVEQGQVSVVG